MEIVYTGVCPGCIICFDWDKALEIIKALNPSKAYIGTKGKKRFTIFDNGKLVDPWKNLSFTIYKEEYYYDDITSVTPTLMLKVDHLLINVECYKLSSIDDIDDIYSIREWPASIKKSSGFSIIEWYNDESEEE